MQHLIHSTMNWCVQYQKSGGLEELRKANGHLKAENNALQRIVEKLGGTVPTDIQQILEDNKSKVKYSTTPSFSSIRGSKLKSESNPDLLKLDSDLRNSLHDAVVPSPPASPNRLSRSSSTSSLSMEEDKPTDVRRTSAASLQGSDYISRSTRIRDGAGSSSSAGSYSIRKDKPMLTSYSSSPSVTTRSASPRRPLASNYGNTYESTRSSKYTPSRYSGTNKDSTSSYSSTSTYNSLPRSSSSSRRDYSKSSVTSSTGSGSTSYQRSGSSYRATPTPYGSSGTKSSYSTNTRSKTGYTSSADTASPSKYSLSKYSSSLSSSRRHAKFWWSKEILPCRFCCI